MIIMESLAGLLALLGAFSFLGLGITSVKTIRHYTALVPIFGYAASVCIAYIFSANFKISGTLAVGYAMGLLAILACLRLRRALGALAEAWKNKEILFALGVICIPLCTLILPGLIIGFKYFYGDVNFDFFYNSQDSWYLQTHNVLDFAFDTKNLNVNASILPLNWSNNYSGRLGASLIASFFSVWLKVDVVYFNSILINTFVILFSLALSVFCREVFRLSKRASYLAIFFTVMSAAYVMSYAYYLFGQISSLPIFIVFCVYLNRFFEDLQADDPSTKSQINKDILVLALLLNALFMTYAILSLYAMALMGFSTFIFYRAKLKIHSIFLFIKILFLAFSLFWLSRLLAIPESINILKGWVSVSGNVVTNRIGGDFIVFSEYLTESFLGLFFGIINYPSPTSILYKYLAHFSPSHVLFFIFEIMALVTVLLAVFLHAKSADTTRAARSILIALVFMTFISATYFFITYTPYALFKTQTWFMPLLMPVLVYGLTKNIHNRIFNYSVKGLCATLLGLNLLVGITYAKDFIDPEAQQQFMNIHGVTRNKNIYDLAAVLKAKKVKNIGLFLTNGVEEAWLANLVREIEINKKAHNFQPLADKDFDENACNNETSINWAPSDLLVLTNPKQDRSEVAELPVGGKIIYQNDSYVLMDPSNLQTFIYFGRGSYPVEFFHGHSTSFPEKFRWVEKGLQVNVYSNKERTTNLFIEVTPGYVQLVNHEDKRTILIKIANKKYQYAIQTKTLITVPNVKLHKGLTCFTVESPDKVMHLPRYKGIIRPHLGLDARLVNFAVSYVGFTKKA